jgi:ATP:ADP antiporter, AAA family
MSTIEIRLHGQQSAARHEGGIRNWLLAITGLRAGEATKALLLTANVFVLLASYYILKTVREALILSEAGAEVKSYSAAAQALLLLAVVPAYGFFASKATRSKLITWVTLFFASNLGVFYLAGIAGLHVGVAFFLWVGIFNVMATAQFWAFANDTYNEETGKRIFPIIGIGSSLGAWAGARLAGQLFVMMDAYKLMLVAAGGLLISIFLIRRVDGRQQTRTEATPEKQLSGKGGFRLVLSTRYLFLIAMMVLMFNLVNSLGEYMLGQMVVNDAKAAVASGAITTEQMRAQIGTFYGNFFGWVNLIGLLLQVFVVSKLFKYIGVRGALFVLPLIALGSYTLMAFLPVLAFVRIAKVLENSTDYSIQNTARHALFLPTSREAKYKAKAAIDTFFWRVGDMLQGAFVLAGTWLAFSARQYAWVNIALVCVWLMLIVGIYREHVRVTGKQ